MINDIGDLVLDNRDRLCIIVDVEYPKKSIYIFALYNLTTESVDKWLEPFDQQLNTSYWQTLA